MQVLNLTGKDISIYNESAFVNLRRVSAKLYTATGLTQKPLMVFKSVGIALIKDEMVKMGVKSGVVRFKTQYTATGFPSDIPPGAKLIVGLPTKNNASTSRHPLASRMASQYMVVRDASDHSIVLGTVGLVY